MLARLLHYARRHRGRFALASSLSVLKKIFDLAPPLLIGLAVDIVVERDRSVLAKIGFEEPMTQIWVLAGLTLLIWALESLFEYLAKLQWRGLAQTIQHELRLDAYAHVQGLEMAYFEDKSTGGLMAVLNDDVNQLERFLDGGADDVLQVLTTVVVISIIYFLLAPSIAWIAMLPIPFILWGSIRFTQRVAPRYADVREQVGLLNSALSNNLQGIATIKSYTAEGHEVERLRAESHDYREANRGAIRLSSAFSPLIRMVIVCGFIGTLVLGGKMCLAGALAPSAYTVMVYMTQRLLWPLTRVGETLDLYHRAMASTGRILDLLDTVPGITPGPRQLEEARGDVALEDLSFHYANGLPVLDGLSIAAPAGETTAIVGPTGSGKTTVIKLLLRFYDPTGGRIALDGTDLKELCFESLRKSIGLVSQDVFLFHGSVKENIAYGTFDAPMEKIVEAAKVAEAHDFIERLPDGYDTIVGERGQKLSGGQRQRISIARAVLKDPPVLVLDEATSSVDNETEAAIQRSLARIAEGRTMIVIAHRLSTIRHADRIFVLEAGTLAEEGTHDELIERDGLYASLWHVQTGELTKSLE